MFFKSFIKYRLYSSDSRKNVSKIIISGGGIIGQTMACALAKNPLFNSFEILVIESALKKDYTRSKDYSNRVSSIAPSTKKLFEKLGMWKHIKRYQIMKDMKVWGYLSHDSINFTHAVDNPAYIVENDEIINAAVMENKHASNIKVIHGAKIKEVLLNAGNQTGKHHIKLEDGTMFDTNLLIGADGANSLVRKVMESNYINWSYKQFGIVGTLLLLDNDENFTAWQRFLPNGPIAILPLDRGISSLVWSVSDKKAKDLLKLPTEAFVDALNDALHSEPQRDELVVTVSDCSKSFLKFLNFKDYLNPVNPPHIASIVPESRAAFPLGFGHSTEYYKPGIVLIGDSAHKVHPLAGQGVNIGFRDIQTLVEKLSEGLNDGRELGSAIDLKRYETEAQRQNTPLMLAIDALHRIYTSDNNFVKAFGNMCFHFTDSVYPLKRIMRQMTT